MKALVMAAIRPASALIAGLAFAGLVAGPAQADYPKSPDQARTWGACPAVAADSHSDKVVRDYNETANHAVLKCGNERWGYWHIYKRHVYDNPEWSNLADIEGVNWRQVVDMAIAKSLDQPDVSGQGPNGTWCYSGQIYLVNKATGQIAKTVEPTVIVAPDGRVVTAFPGGRCQHINPDD
ncbi:hypothetical protein ACFYTQ_11080 [Nocardia sp. NPDC004068]|uniref:hypothetical protein n=1 Tax=Nocardia sp. NPDC004068 TaxID=3364303 RepID=UPI0036A4A5A2